MMSVSDSRGGGGRGAVLENDPPTVILQNLANLEEVSTLQHTQLQPL